MQVAPLEKRDAVEVVRGPTFAVTHTWPDLRNAEYEVLERLALAAKNVGATMIAVDNDGRPLWANRRIALDRSKPLGPSEIDFMISLHFLSPRLIDVYSYYALWQPTDFYFQFGYEDSIKQLLTHNDCLSCLSETADAQGRMLFESRGPLNPEPFPNLFHNVPQPYLEPRIGPDSRAFYIGINWERGGKGKGRHSGLFRLLDAEGLLDIYGPRKLLDFEPWAGFESYRGELPFDGVSTVRAINQAGICLALSSDSHKRSALMSNRLFEGLAGGAAVIVDSNAFAKTYFGDIAYFIDDSGSAEEVAFQIRAVVDDIRRNPDEALERVRRGQDRLRERFSLEGSLKRLIEVHPSRVEHYRQAALRPGSVTVVLAYPGQSLSDLMDNIATVARQTMVTVELVLICDQALFGANQDAIRAAAAGAIRTLKVMPRPLARIEHVAGQLPESADRTGPAVAEALGALNTDYFCFLRSDESWFSDHLASLICALERAPGAGAAVAGVLEQASFASKPKAEQDEVEEAPASRGKRALAAEAESKRIEKAQREARTKAGENWTVETRRRVADLHFTVGEPDLLSAQYAFEYGRFLYPSRLATDLSMDCLRLLDGQEAVLVRLTALLAGRPAESGYATYIRDTAKTERLSKSLELEEHQQQFIRDTVAFDARWQARVAAQGPMPTHVYAYSAGAPVRLDQFQHPVGISRHLPIDQLVTFDKEGAGLKYLERGFSPMEDTGAWIEGDSGLIEFHCSEKAWAAAENRDLMIVMRGRTSHDAGGPQHCTVVLNGVAIAYVEVPEAFTNFFFRLPRNTFSEEGRVRLQLIPDHSEMVYDEDGGLLDGRRLGIQIRQFGVMSRRRPVRPVFVAGDVYPTVDGSEALAALREGFSYPETNWTWILGQSAQLSFEVQNAAPTAKLVLLMTGRNDNQTDKPQSVLVSINGVEAGRFRLPSPHTPVAIPLSPHILGEDGVCSLALEFAHAQPVVDADGEVIDGRLLAAQLHHITIEGVLPPPELEAPPPEAPPSPSFAARVRDKLVRLLQG